MFWRDLGLPTCSFSHLLRFLESHQAIWSSVALCEDWKEGGKVALIYELLILCSKGCACALYEKKRWANWPRFNMSMIEISLVGWGEDVEAGADTACKVLVHLITKLPLVLAVLGFRSCCLLLLSGFQ